MRADLCEEGVFPFPVLGKAEVGADVRRRHLEPRRLRVPDLQIRLPARLQCIDQHDGRQHEGRSGNGIDRPAGNLPVQHVARLPQTQRWL